MRKTVVLVLGTLFLGSVLATAALTAPTLVVYQLEATLEDGGSLSGTFSLDLTAPASSSTPFYTVYPINDFQIELTGTSVFVGTDRGAAYELQLLQNAGDGAQELLFEFRDVNGTSGAFGPLRFSPFSGSNAVLAPIEGSFESGYLDGSGVVNFSSANLSVIPEPSIPILLGLLLANAPWVRRR